MRPARFFFALLFGAAVLMTFLKLLFFAMMAIMFVGSLVFGLRAIAWMLRGRDWTPGQFAPARTAFFGSDYTPGQGPAMSLDGPRSFRTPIFRRVEKQTPGRHIEVL